MTSAIPIALGSASAALLLASAAAFLLYINFLRRKARKSSSPGDPEKALPTARVSDGPDDGPVSTASVTVFSWDEIERMTGKFSSSVIGEGGFSTVYMARLSDSSLAALKIHRDNSERIHRAYKQELEVLLQLRHHNIVRLIGYCDRREGGVLVLEYVPNGNLHEKLHGCRDGIAGSPAIPWARRMSIAFQIAKAVEYLHESCSLQIVHGDIKSSNVLLGNGHSCKLCDFGSARVGFSAAVLPRQSLPSAKSMTGSPGYLDPHYIRTGIVSKKGDVYSFGVLLLELVTGVEAFCSEKEQLLTAVLAPVLRGSARVVEVVDPSLGGHYDVEEAVAVAALAASCVAEQPSLRPSMREISRILCLEVASSISAVDLESKGDRKPILQVKC